jgi:hypothetical protein
MALMANLWSRPGPIEPASPTAPSGVVTEAPWRACAAWSSYWYNGHIYANNFDEDVNSLTESSCGLDVFAISDGLFGKAASVPHLNAATMEPFKGYEQALGH